jgi:hypothetical protein
VSFERPVFTMRRRSMTLADVSDAVRLLERPVFTTRLAISPLQRM